MMLMLFVVVVVIIIDILIQLWRMRNRRMQQISLYFKKFLSINDVRTCTVSLFTQITSLAIIIFRIYIFDKVANMTIYIFIFIITSNFFMFIFVAFVLLMMTFVGLMTIVWLIMLCMKWCTHVLYICLCVYVLLLFWQLLFLLYASMTCTSTFIFLTCTMASM